MREIKFRAWDKETNSMIYNPLGFPELYPTNELMQYTGLKDKNGKEVYEGDILVFKDPPHDESYCEVLFDNNGFFYYVKFLDDGFTDLLSAFSHDGTTVLEVINNIHENPELLE